MAANNKEDVWSAGLLFGSMKILSGFSLLLTISAIRVNKLDLIEN